MAQELAEGEGLRGRKGFEVFQSDSQRGLDVSAACKDLKNSLRHFRVD
jgi:hypothetical protein